MGKKKKISTAERLRHILPYVLFFGPLLAFGIWMVFGLLGSEFEFCSRHASAHHCAPICEQSFFAEDVDDDKRSRACGIAASDFASEGDFDKAIEMLELCQEFGGNCSEEALKDYRCFNGVDGCAERCASGEARECSALIRFYTRASDKDLDKALELYHSACKIEPERCHSYANRLCKNALDACTTWCQEGKEDAAPICFVASYEHEREASELEMNSYQGEEGISNDSWRKESIARHRNAAKQVFAQGCHHSPLARKKCPEVMCFEHPKQCSRLCKDEKRAPFCFGLGTAYEKGSEKLPKSEAQALAFRVRACETDMAVDPGCARLLCEGDLAACQARCDANSAPHCYSLGQARAAENADEGNALRLKACTLDKNVAKDCDVYLNAPTLD